jgi:AraC-like DNA-binding protein
MNHKIEQENILNLNPVEFDKHFFISDWQPPTFGFFKRFHIARVESYRDFLALPLPPHRRSVHYFMFLRTGTVIRSKGISSYELKGGQIFFLPANQINTIEFVSEDASGFYCHFQPDIFLQPYLRADLENLFPFFQIKSEPVIQVEEINKIEALCTTLEKEYFLSQQDRFDIIPSYLLTLLLEIKHSTFNANLQIPNAAVVITQKYKNALAEFIYTKKSISEFADYLAVSPNHLNKCVKESTGKSAHILLTEMRILEAKVLLKQTDLSVGEIAFKVGQFETSDFCRLFKKNTKVAPIQYRKMQN